jgi:diguanylate cyclase (GGDEF)-like protein
MSIEIKMVIGAIFFTLLLVGVERYQFSENIVEQFLESKESKNKLLMDTISPIISLNISLGLEDANQEYLDQIVNQNHDLLSFELINTEGKKLYSYVKNPSQKLSKKIDGVYLSAQSIVDPLTGQKFGVLYAHFDDHEYQRILQKNKEATFKLFAIALSILIIFIGYIKREFIFLKKLSEHVLNYDPQNNNFTLTASKRTDEVGVIHNAIISMVNKINTYATLLDEMNYSLALKVQERTKELQEANAQLQELSLTDPLTQLSNRRGLEIHIQNLWELAKRNSVAISIIMCDIDHFKMVNDTYGHLVGDYVLMDIAKILKISLKRKADFIARYGGEEFIIVLYDTDSDAAKELCITIQQNLKAFDGFAYSNAKLEAVTLSFGIATAIPQESSQYEDLLKYSDVALYQAKEEGRDRFVILS